MLLILFSISELNELSWLRLNATSANSAHKFVYMVLVESCNLAYGLCINQTTACDAAVVNGNYRHL